MTPPARPTHIPFNSSDPLEAFTNDLGSIPFNRSPAAPGTGVTTPRQQINTENSFIDAEVVYGARREPAGLAARGPTGRQPGQQRATLMLSPTGYLPAADQRGNPTAAPAMDVDGRLRGSAEHAADRR